MPAGHLAIAAAVAAALVAFAVQAVMWSYEYADRLLGWFITRWENVKKTEKKEAKPCTCFLLIFRPPARGCRNPDLLTSNLDSAQKTLPGTGF